MESRKDRATELHDKGYNCAQAVACAYCDLIGIDEETMFKICEGLGLGMGSTLGTCGALTGACILAGCKYSTANLDAPDSKKSTYALSRQLVESFRERNSSIVCRELKGALTGEVLRPCPLCITDACEFAEEVLFAD